jgi:hypothetical protein
VRKIFLRGVWEDGREKDNGHFLRLGRKGKVASGLMLAGEPLAGLNEIDGDVWGMRMCVVAGVSAGV